MTPINIMEEKVRITVDGKELEVPKGKTVLQVALERGINIPYFCYHPKLKIIGACRMCIAYNEKTGRLFTTCNTPVEDGMVISTKHPTVVENQRYLLQALMTRHPLDCPICDKAGECDLQNYGAIYGPKRQIVPISALEKDRNGVDWESDFLEYYSNRCVVCYRCTRACSDVVGANALYVEERGFHTNIAPAEKPFDTSSCEMCGLCVYVCPVGAIISKPFKYWTRSWLLQRGKTACNLCPLGCEIQVEYGLGDWRSERRVYRTKPTDELHICAKAFFGYDVLSSNRLLYPVMYGREETVGGMINLLVNILKSKPQETAIILSNFTGNEVLDIIHALVKSTGCYISSTLTLDFLKFLEGYGNYEQISFEEFKNAGAYVLVGDDITSTVPVLSYYMRGRVYSLYGERTRDKKLNPVYISWKELFHLKEEALVVVNTTGLEDARAWGEKLRGYKVYPIHYGANFWGVYERFKGVLSDLPALMSAIVEGRVKNLILFGEDLLDYYEPLELKGIFDNLEKLILFTPFDDGLSHMAHVKIPMNLYGEANSSLTSLMGKVELRGFLPWRFREEDFYQDLLSVLPKEEKHVPMLKGEGEFKKPELHLYWSNWIIRRSKNLKRLYEKQVSLRT